MLIIFVRTLLLYLLVLIVMRVMGKWQIGELQLVELVVTIIIADLVTVPMQDKRLALINGIIPVFTFDRPNHHLFSVTEEPEIPNNLWKARPVDGSRADQLR